jgi:RNA polymerase sigma factor (sigma-70 family)
MSSTRQNADSMLRTRASLLRRLRNWQDQTSWQDFFNLYWKLIYGLARKSGLTDDEAQDAVQETLISVARHMPTFRYDPAIGSFKAWLLNMTRWRIIAQFRKRRTSRTLAMNSATQTDVMDRIPDFSVEDLNAKWEAEWQTNLLNAAIANVKHQLNPEQYRIFDFYANKEWPPEKVAERFDVSPNQVYKIKHRVTKAIRTEVRRLEKEMT